MDGLVGHGGHVRKRCHELYPLVTILLLATMLRAGWPRLTEFKFDEARLQSLVLELTQQGRLPLHGLPSSAGFEHSPISIYLFAPAFLFTADPILVAIYSGLMGVAAVALCWWLARRWLGGGLWAALTASLLLTTNPWAVVFTRKSWQVVFVPVLVLAFVGLLVSALVGKRQWNLAWALMVYALLVQVHPSAIPLALALGLWLLVFWREVRLGPLLAGLGLGMLTAIPFLFYQIYSGWPLLTAWRALPEATWDLSAVRLAWEAITGTGIHALAGEAYPFLGSVTQISWFFNLFGWLTIAAVLGLLWRTVTGWRMTDIGRQKAARVDLILITWLIVPVAFNLRHSLPLHLHSFVLVLPAACLIIGRAVEALFGMLQSVTFGRVLRVASLMGIGLLVAGQVVVLALMAHLVATYPTPGGFGTPLGHYLDVANQAISLALEEGAAEILVVGQGDSVVVDEIPVLFDVLLRDWMAHRFVDGQSTALFPAQRTVVLLTPEAGNAADWYQPWPGVDIRDPYGSYRLIVLDGSWPQESFEAISGPRLFENGVELQGYTWSGDIVPGKQAQFWLLWQNLWLSPEDTHFSAQVLDRDEQQWGQHDIVGYPTPYRRKGDRVISKFDINIFPGASLGPYKVRVGQYLFPQVVNVPVIDESGNPTADVVLVGP